MHAHELGFQEERGLKKLFSSIDICTPKHFIVQRTDMRKRDLIVTINLPLM